MTLGLIAIVSVAVVTVLAVIASMLFRIVVSKNEVHVVQYGSGTKVYGNQTENGNSYYNWPEWIPFYGVKAFSLTLSVFDITLEDYEAYDKGRLPFVVDVKAFFRIANPEIAASRVNDISELYEQLEAIVQGAIRSILASNDIETILQGRSKFGDEFTTEVNDHLQNWGVTSVKNIELMDIRDSSSSDVIQNIMAKKKSFIEMESRKEVAENRKQAEIKEIESNREIQLNSQSARQEVESRTVEVDQAVALKQASKEQILAEQNKITTEKKLEVESAKRIKLANIDKDEKVIDENKEKEVALIEAETNLAVVSKQAEGVKLTGQAKADAEKAIQLAPIEAQIQLAKEIGENANYQNYLIKLEEIKANQLVGIEQAKMLGNADIKIIANGNTIEEGAGSIPNLLGSSLGVKLGSVLEGLKSTPEGEKILSKLD